MTSKVKFHPILKTKSHNCRYLVIGGFLNLTNKKTMRTVKDYTIIPIEACKYFNPRQLYLLAGL